MADVTKVKQWVAIAAAASLVLGAASWFLLISPKRGEAAELRDQAAAQRLTNAQLTAQVAALRAMAEQLPRKRQQLAEVEAKIPAGPALPTLVRALTAAARSAGVELVSVAPGPPAPLAVAAPPAPPAPADGSAPADPAAPAAAAPAGVSAIPLTLNVIGDFHELEQFVAHLEDLPRALRISALTISPGTSPTDTRTTSATAPGRSLSATVTGQVFLTGTPAAAPAAPGAAPAAAPSPGAAPAPAAAAAPVPVGANATAPASQEAR